MDFHKMYMIDWLSHKNISGGAFKPLDTVFSIFRIGVRYQHYGKTGELIAMKFSLYVG